MACPFAGSKNIHGVTHDGKRVWAATGPRLLAMLALALASVGLYGVVAYGVARRTIRSRQVGERIAIHHEVTSGTSLFAWADDMLTDAAATTGEGLLSAAEYDEFVAGLG